MRNNADNSPKNLPSFLLGPIYSWQVLSNHSRSYLFMDCSVIGKCGKNEHLHVLGKRPEISSLVIFHFLLPHAQLKNQEILQSLKIKILYQLYIIIHISTKNGEKFVRGSPYFLFCSGMINTITQKMMHAPIRSSISNSPVKIRTSVAQLNMNK